MTGSKALEVIERILTIISLGGTIFSTVKGYMVLAIILGALTLLLILLAVVVYAQRGQDVFARIVRFWSTPKGTYYLKHRDVTYEYADRTTINHSKVLTAHALSNGVREVEDSFCFSGNAVPKIMAPCNGQEIVDEHIEFGRTCYSIRNRVDMQKGSNMDFKMKLETIKDNECKARTFLAATIYEPTKLLTMTVKFGKTVTPESPKLFIYPTAFSRTPIRKEKDLVFDNDSRTLSYREHFPSVGYRYRIEWNFNDANGQN